MEAGPIIDKILSETGAIVAVLLLVLFFAARIIKWLADQLRIEREQTIAILKETGDKYNKAMTDNTIIMNQWKDITQAAINK